MQANDLNKENCKEVHHTILRREWRSKVAGCEKLMEVDSGEFSSYRGITRCEQAGSRRENEWTINVGMRRWINLVEKQNV